MRAFNIFYQKNIIYILSMQSWANTLQFSELWQVTCHSMGQKKWTENTQMNLKKKKKESRSGDESLFSLKNGSS